jgi:hypothetical protein
MLSKGMVVMNQDHFVSGVAGGAANFLAEEVKVLLKTDAQIARQRKRKKVEK